MADTDCPDNGSAPISSDAEQSPQLSQKQKTRLMMLSERAGIPFEEAVSKQMSQRQLKKMASALRYEQILKSKRKEEKEVRKKFRRQKKELHSDSTPKKKKQRVLMKDSPNRLTLVIDLSFFDLMSESDKKKLRKQIGRCYSVNRSAEAPVQLQLTSCTPEMREQLSGGDSGFMNWDIHVSDQSYLQLYAGCEERKRLLYLTRDSQNVLPEASQIKATGGVYVIGGLVDHNSHKGLTLKQADSDGIQHARLPIDEHLKMSSSQVLTVNQVFELLLLVSQGTEWPVALMATIPQRKIHPSFKSDKCQPCKETAVGELQTTSASQSAETSAEPKAESNTTHAS